MKQKLANKCKKNLWLHKILYVMLLPISIIMCHGKGLAQDMVASGNEILVSEENSGHQEIQSLAEVLTNLEENFEVSFLYDFNLVKNKKVEVTNLEGKDMETILEGLLKSTDLSFNKIGDNYYVIKPNKKSQPVQKLEKKAPDTSSSRRQSTGESFPGNNLKFLAKKGLDERIPQQGFTVSGIVTDESGEGLPGVNVVIKGTAGGTVTDVNGNFNLNTSENDTLIFSFVGYQSREVPVNGRSTININLAPSVSQLEEVVVVGFGEQQSITTTGAITQVKAKEINNTSFADMGSAITGKMPGLSTVQTTGQPGESDPQLYLRGISTMNNTNPLIIIDGIPSSERRFMQMDPTNVENISILKDASATSVYGVKGANGVIIVRTKRGESGEAQISAKTSFGAQVPTQFVEYANAYNWAKGYNETVLNDGDSSMLIPQWHLKNFKNGDQPLIFPDHNWTNEFYDNAALQTRSNINISGGTEDVQYYSAVGYLRQEGLITDYGPQSPNFQYDRFNIRTNLDFNVTNTTKIAFTSDARIGIRKDPSSNDQEFWQRLNTATPMATAGLVDGKLINPDSRYQQYASGRNPFNYLYGQGYIQNSENRLNINLDFEQQLKALTPSLEGLKFRTKIGYRSGFEEVMNKGGRGFASYNALYKTDLPGNPFPGDSTVALQKIGEEGTESWSYGYNADRYIYWEAGFDYEKTFGRNNIGGLLMYRQDKDYYPPWGWQFTNIPTGTAGLVGRVTYDYDQKYLLEFNLGYNGSENFAKENRFGWFPAVSGGWVISQENFMDGVNFLNRLKLRFSYGKVGNDQAGGNARFIYIGDRYNRGGSQWYGYNFGNAIPEFQQGVHEASVGNPNVTWETAIKQNYGIDVKVFEGKLAFNFDYFYEHRDDILLNRNTDPAWLSINLPPLNIGEVENSGFETQVTWQNEVNDFSYSISGNISRAQNKILYMDEVPPIEPYQKRTGHPLNSNFGYIWKGFYTEAQIQQIEEGNLPDPDFDVEAGDMQYEDLNGDGIIDQADQKIFGYPSQPQVTGGFNVNLGYKGFDLSFGLQGAAEVSRNLTGIFKEPFGAVNSLAALQTHMDHSWSPERAEAGNVKWPQLTFDNEGWNNRTSTFWNRNASYIRMRQAEIGYTFSDNVLQTTGLDNLRIYVNGNNLFTLTKDEYTMIDPEREPGQFVGYPIIRVFNAGIDITL